MYDSGQFDSSTMTKWEKCHQDNKTWLAVTSFFEKVVDNMETYKGNSGNATARQYLTSAMQVISRKESQQHSKE